MTINYRTDTCTISVAVSDYGRSLAWYRDVLGFEVQYELTEYGWCELTTPYDFNIGLGQAETVTPGTVVPTFGVQDIDETIEYLRSHDVKTEDWHEVPDMVRLATFWDPDGNPWMLAQPLDQKSDRGA